MNLILKNLLDNAEKRKENYSSPLFMPNIQAEKQDRPLPGDLEEQQDIPCGDPAKGLFADVVYPRNREPEALPVMVFVHGGALVTGDRKTNRIFCQELARRGFVVYSVEYRLIDRANVYGMVSDVCAALSMVKATAMRFGGDTGRISLCGESAGAFLAIYAAAAGKSETLCREFGCQAHGLELSRLILISGMIYTTGNNPIGLIYKKTLYTEKSRDRSLMAHLAPDNPQIISLLPSILLVSSKADFLRGNTLNYAKALKHFRHEHKLIYYSDNKALTHAFPSLLPSLPESGDVIDAIRDWVNGRIC